jgi:UTP--glucose-1-phosphate uridylyltransferase
MDISKIIIPAAGLGTRFLPFAKTVSRELLPILQKPMIQHIAEEAFLSDLRTMLIITGKNQEIIANHFDRTSIDPLLKEHDKEGLLTSLEKLSSQAEFTYIRQPEPLGLGHAVWLARHSIQKEYFAIGLPDDLIVSKQPALSQLIRIARQEKASVIAVQEVPSECLSSYGIVAIKKVITPHLFHISHAVEKPQPKDAPSNLAIVGRYVLSSKIFQTLDDMAAYNSTDLPLTDAINLMMQNNERVYAYKVQGTRYDLGTPIGYVKAVIGTALQDPELGPAVKKFLADLDSPESFLYNPAKILEHTL